jgi:superfamily II DNA helicase RecQ
MKAHIYKEFKKSDIKLRIIICTIAFGTCIDKSDIRKIILEDSHITRKKNMI